MERSVNEILLISQVRTQESKGLPPQISTEDFLPRFEEFQRFEDSFADCLSKTAVKTKFAQHTSRGAQVLFKCNSLKFDNIMYICKILIIKMSSFYAIKILVKVREMN
jgi:hypothetical protein